MGERIRLNDHVVILKPEAIESRGHVMKVTDEEIYITNYMGRPMSYPKSLAIVTRTEEPAISEIVGFKVKFNGGEYLLAPEDVAIITRRD